MKTTGILLASCAAVASAKLFQMQVNTAPDKHVGLIAKLDGITVAHRKILSGYGASLELGGIYCQAYSDANGRDELGEPFWRGQNAVFSKDGRRRRRRRRR
ncbi:hypothetical protein GX50_08995 [[Emmonsia] crescens]|uniref:Uncharacterized protein n=1 Tax=[Emmonsia] crescens TaxID=73230 RepID=A0A2B7YEG6_9EURO|nr:hypothetical protein GX50_08995 [Emmonsia crescens]